MFKNNKEAFDALDMVCLNDDVIYSLKLGIIPKTKERRYSLILRRGGWRISIQNQDLCFIVTEAIKELKFRRDKLLRDEQAGLSVKQPGRSNG